MNAYSGKRLLIVTAHPDDESMFFGAVVRELRRRGAEVYVLCLSTGNADGLGAQRIDELYYSCSLMGIPQHCVTFVDDVALQDGQYVKWDEVLVGSYVMEMCEIVKPDMVLTFDAYGVSGHVNHRCTYAGVRQAWASGLLAARGKRATDARGPDLYILESIPLLLKYLGIFTAFFYWIVYNVFHTPSARNSTFYWNINPKMAWQSMAAHASQFVWYRRLFVLFSVYSYCCVCSRIVE